MRAVTWQGRRNVRVETVPDPVIQERTDAIVRVTSTGLCDVDLRLYEQHDTLAPFLRPGDVLGHEAVGIVEETGSQVPELKPGDRVVVPFHIACGHCWMCSAGLPGQCRTTHDPGHDTGAALFGRPGRNGSVPGAQAEYLRVPQAQFGPIQVPDGPPDDRFLYLSDVLPSAWQAVRYADIPPAGTVAVLGLGPLGDMACRIALQGGASHAIGVDVVPERLARARKRGVEVFDPGDYESQDELIAAIGTHTFGRGPDAVIHAVGTEAHDGLLGRLTEARQASEATRPQDRGARRTTRTGADRLAALHLAISLVRRGGTLSLGGDYGGTADPLPLMTLSEKHIQLRAGRTNVHRWSADIMSFLADDDPLGVDDFATHHLPLERAPHAYDLAERGADGAVKVLMRP
ncbi:glutathione-dependent formaldehyde dehydrogenase [Streptomyces sp. ERV7]|uniref:alcohol dehydrogenase catalytic domain-containing protein n=1 Tax=Streptomyces sp. ERV7 TaxID=1322334 RepID=UPI0007F3AAAA|nr:alcohol dehydrogenase catalytic domain-containing protein [Streptomyces sp. ERV7]OAR27035.1 glutathione-dependent formaldehyde dehydrogenase [Streptomyces sp. ERV7]